MDLTKKPLSKWLKDIITLVVGILLIIAGATGEHGYTDAISQVIGITLIVLGSICVLFALFVGCKLRSGFALLGAPGTIMLLLGISLVMKLWASAVIKNLLTIIPFLVIAIGVIFLVDALMLTIFAGKKEKKSFVYMLPEYIFSIAALVIGILCLVEKDGSAIIHSNVQLIVLGIIVCLYAVYDFLLTVVKLPKSIAVVKLGK